LLQASEELAKIAAPFQLDEVDAKDVVPAIWASRVAFAPSIETVRTNNPEAAWKDNGVFRQIKAK
jgi:hypothetical protein